jgi:hypothetical protein
VGVESRCVDHACMHQAQGFQVVVERVADDDGAGGEEGAEVGVDVREGGGDSVQGLFCDTAEGSVVVGNGAGGLDEGVVYDAWVGGWVRWGGVERE